MHERPKVSVSLLFCRSWYLLRLPLPRACSCHARRGCKGPPGPQSLLFSPLPVAPGQARLTKADLPRCPISMSLSWEVMIYPGAFNMTTGPAHYQLLARGRAVDTQSYVASQHEFPEDPEGFYKLLSARWHLHLQRGAVTRMTTRPKGDINIDHGGMQNMARFGSHVKAWGHSQLVNPWAEVVLEAMNKTRFQLPLASYLLSE